MQQKKIIIFTISLFVLGSAYLFYVSDHGRNLDQDKSWWVVYFADPKSDNLDFVIENHSDSQDFRWEVFSNKEKKIEGGGIISKGERKSVAVNLDDSDDKKITVDVFNGDEKKEIYKNF